MPINPAKDDLKRMVRELPGLVAEIDAVVCAQAAVIERLRAVARAANRYRAVTFCGPGTFALADEYAAMSRLSEACSALRPGDLGEGG